MIAILAITLPTLMVLGLMCLLIYKKYKDKGANVWFIHPLFLFNGLVLLTFFIPYFFHLAFGMIKPGLKLITPQNVKDLSIICIAFMSLNIFIHLLESIWIKNSKDFEFFIKKKDVLLIVILFFITISFQIISIPMGGYYFGPFAVPNPPKVSLGWLGLIRFFTETMKYFVWIGLSFLYFTKFKMSKRYKVFLWSLIILNMIYAFPSGSKRLILTPLIIFIFCYYIFEKKIRKMVKTAFLFFIFLCVSFPSYNTWRNWVGKRAKAVASGKNMSYMEMISGHSVARQRGKVFFFINEFIGRLNNFSAYFILTDFYPQEYEFLKGRSYLPILFSPIPRIIFPSKPQMTNVNEIGRKVGLINPDDYVTTPGLGWWGELYINFGYPGVFLGLILAGLFYEIFFILWLKRKESFVFTISYLTFLLHMIFGIHSSLAGLFAEFIKFVVVISLIMLMIYTPFWLRKKIQWKG